MSVRRSVTSPVGRGAAPFISRSRLVGCGVTVWLDVVVEPLCGAVNYDTILKHLRACLFTFTSYHNMFQPGKQAFDYCVFIFASVNTSDYIQPFTCYS